MVFFKSGVNQRFKREEPQPQTPASTPPASATESVSVGTTKTGKFLICEEKGGGGERERKKGRARDRYREK